MLEKGWRREPALRLTLAQMYVQAVSTRQVTVITEDLCGTEVSETPVSQASPTIEPNRLPIVGNGFDDQRSKCGGKRSDLGPVSLSGRARTPLERGWAKLFLAAFSGHQVNFTCCLMSTKLCLGPA